MKEKKISRIESDISKLLSKHANNKTSLKTVRQLTKVIKSSENTSGKVILGLDNIDKRFSKAELKDKQVIETLSELKSAIDEFNVVDIQSVEVKNPIKEVTVKNLKDIPVQKEVSLKESKWLPQLFKSIVEAVKQTEKDIQAVRIVDNNSKTPISVRLSDGKRFYVAISQAVSSGFRIPFKTASGVPKEALVNEDGSLVIDQKETTDFNGAPVTVGTTAVELTFTGITQAIGIQADHDNAGNIWIGKSNVTNVGGNAMTRLMAGESLDIELNDTSEAVYVISDTASQKVYKLALT